MEDLDQFPCQLQQTYTGLPQSESSGFYADQSAQRNQAEPFLAVPCANTTRKLLGIQAGFYGITPNHAPRLGKGLASLGNADGHLERHTVVNVPILTLEALRTGVGGGGLIGVKRRDLDNPRNGLHRLCSLRLTAIVLIAAHVKALKDLHSFASLRFGVCATF
jgi:hypothetical protein